MNSFKYSKILTLLCLTAFFVFIPMNVNARTTEQVLLDQINQLLEIVESLQAQLLELQRTPDLEGYIFSKDLGPGDTDIEVQLVQMALNKAGFTVAQSGPGSVGEETQYYGERTEHAVRRLQASYAAIALHPAGNYYPTGIIDTQTRLVLNNLKGSITQLDNPVEATMEPKISYIVPAEGFNGTEVTIVGENFQATGNSINTTYGFFDNISSPDGKTLKVTIFSEFLQDVLDADLDIASSDNDVLELGETDTPTSENNLLSREQALIPTNVEIRVNTNAGFSNIGNFLLRAE